MTNKKLHLIFLSCCAGIILVNLGFFRQLLNYSLTHEFASDIFMIPVLSALLVLRKRTTIFAQPHSPSIAGTVMCLTLAVALLWFNNAALIYGKTLSFVILLLGLFLSFYGLNSFRRALFPLLFLILMVPIPEPWIEHIVVFLQKGSAEVVALLFTVTGTPYHREGVVFALPKVTIEIASQCSGIRSTIALLLSCLLAAHLILTRISRKFLFILIAVPMALFKNALRIATLSILAIHVDVNFVGGNDLHRKGGVFFFITTLLLMTPILWLLRRSEKA
jgi:exosortase